MSEKVYTYWALRVDGFRKVHAVPMKDSSFTLCHQIYRRGSPGRVVDEEVTCAACLRALAWYTVPFRLMRLGKKEG